MSFGFSVGDFVAAAKLINDIVSSLRTSSTSEYHEITLELHGLKRALYEIEHLQCSPSQQPAVNAIKVAALMCQYPLEQFAEKLKKYESLGVEHGGKLGKKDLLKMWGKKLKWGFVMEEELLRLRAYLVAHVGSLNMRLMTQGLVTASVSAERAGEAQSVLVEGLQRSHTAVLETRNDVRDIGSVALCSNVVLRKLSELVTGDVLPQLKTLVDLATKVWNSNLQIIGLMVKLQSTSLAPDLRRTWLQEPIRFEDALGRILPVPSEYNWGKLEAIILDQFSSGPGHEKVSAGEYELFNTRDSSQIISRSEYNGLTPGMSITMAIIIDQYDQGSLEQCPRPGCRSKKFVAVEARGRVCTTCKLSFGESRRAIQGPFRVPALECFVSEHEDGHPRGTKRKRGNSDGNAKGIEDVFREMRTERKRLKNIRLHRTPFPAPRQLLRASIVAIRNTRATKTPNLTRYNFIERWHESAMVATPVPEARVAEDQGIPTEPEIIDSMEEKERISNAILPSLMCSISPRSRISQESNGLSLMVDEVATSSGLPFITLAQPVPVSPSMPFESSPIKRNSNAVVDQSFRSIAEDYGFDPDYFKDNASSLAAFYLAATTIMDIINMYERDFGVRIPLSLLLTPETPIETLRAVLALFYFFGDNPESPLI